MSETKSTHHPGARSGPRAPFLIDDGASQVQVESLGSLARALVNLRDPSRVRIIDAAGRVWSHQDFLTAVPAADEVDEAGSGAHEVRSGGRWLTIGGLVMVGVGLVVLLTLGRNKTMSTGPQVPPPVTTTDTPTAPPPTPTSDSLERELVGRYLADGAAVTVIPDESSRGSQAVVMVADSKLGRPVGLFNGHGWLTIPRIVDQDFTIAFWVQTHDVGGMPDNPKAPWYHGIGLVNAEIPGICDDFGITVLGGCVAFGVGNPDQTAHSSTPINDGRWHHIAVLRDNRSGTMALFLNGQPDQVLQGAPGTRSAPKEIIIGAHSPKWAELHGRLADVRFYRRQLSVQEIAELTRRRGADR